MRKGLESWVRRRVTSVWSCARAKASACKNQSLQIISFFLWFNSQCIQYVTIFKRGRSKEGDEQKYSSNWRPLKQATLTFISEHRLIQYLVIRRFFKGMCVYHGLCHDTTQCSFINRPLLDWRLSWAAAWSLRKWGEKQKNVKEVKIIVYLHSAHCFHAEICLFLCISPFMEAK